MNSLEATKGNKKIDKNTESGVKILIIDLENKCPKEDNAFLLIVGCRQSQTCLD